MSGKTSALGDNIAALAQQIDALDPGEDKAKLTLRFQRAVEDLARRISSAAKKESK